MDLFQAARIRAFPKTETAAGIDVNKKAVAKGVTLEKTLATISFLGRYPEPGADEAKAFFQNGA